MVARRRTKEKNLHKMNHIFVERFAYIKYFPSNFAMMMKEITFVDKNIIINLVHHFFFNFQEFLKLNCWHIFCYKKKLSTFFKQALQILFLNKISP